MPTKERFTMPSLRNVLLLIRFDKPVGTLLLLWPTLTALWLVAGQFPGWKLLCIFTLGTFLMRSAGCCINDIADRNFDRHVKRTANRPVTTGAVSVKQAIVIAVVLMLLAFALVLMTNGLTVMLSFAAVALTLFYPYTKRFFSIPQAVLGVVFSFGIPMAFAAVLGRVPWDAWVLVIINLYWVLAYDTIYAMVDRDDDLKIGIKTSAITFGDNDVSVIMACYLLYIGSMTAAAWHFGLHWPFYVGLFAACCLTLYFFRLIEHRDRDRCLRAFRQNHWFGLMVFLGMLAERYWFANYNAY